MQPRKCCGDREFVPAARVMQRVAAQRREAEELEAEALGLALEVSRVER